MRQTGKIHRTWEPWSCSQKDASRRLCYCLPQLRIINHNRSTWCWRGEGGFSRAGAGTAQAGASRLTKRVKIATSPCASITALPSCISSPLFPQHQPSSSPSPCLSLSSLLLTCLRLLVLICCFSDTHHCGESFPITSTASHTSAFESCTEMSFKLLSIMATMTHFQSPGSLPGHDCVSLNAANQPSSPTSPFWRNPASPSSSCWEEEHVLLSCWGESSHFPERLPQEKSSFLSFYLFIFISGGSQLVTACSASTFYHTPRWCRAPCLKAFQGKRVRDFHAFSSSGPSQSWVIIHSCRRVRDDAPLTFHRPHAPQPNTSDRFVVADPRQKGLSEPNICCFLPEPQPGATYLSS